MSAWMKTINRMMTKYRLRAALMGSAIGVMAYGGLTVYGTIAPADADNSSPVIYVNLDSSILYTQVTPQIPNDSIPPLPKLPNLDSIIPAPDENAEPDILLDDNENIRPEPFDDERIEGPKLTVPNDGVDDGQIDEDEIFDENAVGADDADENSVAPSDEDKAKAALEIFTTPEAREKRLKELFVRLQDAKDESSAELVAEEIWAAWLQSGSASVDYLIRRGSTAQAQGDIELARTMFDHVITLQPEYAEGWSRSGRLAMDMEDYNTAFSHSQKAMMLETRHFYAMWTMGNMLERLERESEALIVYKEVLKLHPMLKSVKDRVLLLENAGLGEVL